MIFGHFIFFGHFPIEIPIEAENFLGRALQLSLDKNKNCFEIFMAKEMGLDRAPIDFQTFYFSHVLLVPPSVQAVCPGENYFLIVMLIIDDHIYFDHL